MKTYLVTLQRTVTETAVIEVLAADKKTAAYNASSSLKAEDWARDESAGLRVKSVEVKPEPQLALVDPQPTTPAPADPAPEPAKRKVRSV